MNILQNLFAPDSITDLFILKFGLYFSLLLLLPFISLVIGSLLFSLLHVTKAKVYQNSNYYDFAKFTSELAVKKMPIRILFGVLPFLGAAFFYSQLYAQQSGAPENLFFAFLIFLAGICLSVLYKNSFKLINDSEKIEQKRTFNKSGWFGLVLIFAASYILISYLQLGLERNFSEIFNIFGIVFTTNSILIYLLFLVISFSLTSALVLTRLNRQKDQYNFYEYGQEFSAKTGILFNFIQPLIYVLFIFSVANYALSFSFFVTSILILLVMLLISVQFYVRYRKQNLKNTSIVFFFLLLFSMLIYNNQLTTEKVKNFEDVKTGSVFNIFS